MPSLTADSPRAHSASEGTLSSKRGEATRTWEAPGASAVRARSEVLSSLEQGYTLRKPESILRFLEETDYPNLLSLLKAAYFEIKQYFPTAQIFLEIIPSPQGSNGEQLRISIATDMEECIIIEQLHQLEQRWLEAFPGMRGKFFLTTEGIAHPGTIQRAKRGEEEEEDEIPAHVMKLLDAMTRMDHDALWRIAQRNILVREADAGLEKLQAKRRRKALSAAEEQRRIELLQQYDEGILIRAQALALLKRGGRNIDALLVLP